MRYLTRLGPLGTAALFVIVIAVAAAIAFLPGGDDVPADLPGPGVGATVAPRPLGPPAAWYVEFFSTKGERPASNGPAQPIGTLDLSFPRAPFGDFADDRWYVVVDAEFHAGGAPGTFSLEYQGEIRVLAADAVVAKGTSRSVATLDVTTPSGTFTLRIEARDAGGPFRLRWKG